MWWIMCFWTAEFSNCPLKCDSCPHTGLYVSVSRLCPVSYIGNHISWEKALKMWGRWGRKKHYEANPVQNDRIAVFFKTWSILSLPQSPLPGMCPWCLPLRTKQTRTAGGACMHFIYCSGQLGAVGTPWGSRALLFSKVQIVWCGQQPGAPCRRDWEKKSAYTLMTKMWLWEKNNFQKSALFKIEWFEIYSHFCLSFIYSFACSFIH